MNATLSNPGASHRRRASADDLAAELLAAGEALCRAARVLPLMTQSPSRTEQARRPSGSSSLEPAERLSGKQLGAIRAASRRAGLSRDRLAALLDQLTGKDEPASLTRADASLVLDKLSEMTGYAR